MTYLLDSNVCIQFLRNRHALVVQRINARQPHELRLCSVVAAELFYGCLCSAQHAANRAKVDGFIKPYICLPFDEGAANIHANIRRHLELLGTPVGPNDLQIAAIALTHGVTLVTHNTSEFSRVPNLMIEDWEIP